MYQNTSQSLIFILKILLFYSREKTNVKRNFCLWLFHFIFNENHLFHFYGGCVRYMLLLYWRIELKILLLISIVRYYFITHNWSGINFGIVGIGIESTEINVKQWIWEHCCGCFLLSSSYTLLSLCCSIVTVLVLIMMAKEETKGIRW